MKDMTYLRIYDHLRWLMIFLLGVIGDVIFRNRPVVFVIYLSSVILIFFLGLWSFHRRYKREDRERLKIRLAPPLPPNSPERKLCAYIQYQGGGAFIRSLIPFNVDGQLLDAREVVDSLVRLGWARIDGDYVILVRKL